MGCSRSCRRFIARPGSLALSPLAPKVPACLAALSVGVVCPLLTHTFSEPTASFIPPPTNPPTSAAFWLQTARALLPLPPLLPSPPPLDALAPPKCRSLAARVAPPSHPQVPMPRGCHPSQGPPSTWPPEAPAFLRHLLRDAEPLRGTVPPKLPHIHRTADPAQASGVSREGPRDREGSALQTHGLQWSQEFMGRGQSARE